MCLAYAHKILELQMSEVGISRVVADMLAEYDETLQGAWKRESDKAIEDSVKEFMKSPDNTTGYYAMLAVLTASLASITNKKEVKKLTVLVDSLYKIIKKNEAEKLASAFKMTKLDRGVVRALANDGPYWIGNFYTDHMSQRIAEVGYNVTVKSGFGRVEAGRTLKDVLADEFALRGGPSAYPSVVPARYAGNVDTYTRIVSANVSQRSRVYSSISAMGDAGIERYVFSAQMDERTSEMCQELHGRVFTVQSATRILNDVSTASDPRAFMKTHPWPKNVEYVRAVAGSGSIVEQSANLQQAGIQMPPLHGFCRSVVVALD